ncbi:hypothetical protein THAOC_27528, partial [Thalassiosira oceanica]
MLCQSQGRAITKSNDGMDSMDSSLQVNSQDGEGSTAVAHIKAIRRPQVPELASTCSGSRSPDSQDSRYHQKNELTEIN